MKVVEELRMNGGTGDTSYAKNSLLQRKGILMAKSITEEAITSLYTSLNNPNTISIADLGCSSGPNTLLAVSNLVKAVDNQRKKLRRLHSPEFQIYLNDLPTNDFNTIFRSLPDFRREMGDGFGRLCFFNGVPGSFYDRLFPSDTLHFVHSSYSLHWLSQVPKGIEDNKLNICVASASPPNVINAYYDQFAINFSTFLKHRSEELVKGGRMVLSFFGKKDENPVCDMLLELLGMPLKELVAEGFVEEEKLISFNVPIYTPSPSEVKSLFEKDGSFIIDCLEDFQIPWTGSDESDDDDDDDDDDDTIGDTNDDAAYNVARCMRAVFEPLIVSHFGEGIIEEVFRRYTNMIAADFMSLMTVDDTCIIVSAHIKM